MCIYIYDQKHSQGWTHLITPLPFFFVFLTDSHYPPCSRIIASHSTEILLLVLRQVVEEKPSRSTLPS